MSDARTDGRCLCGAVSFQVSGEPLWVVHCHCESCRRQTGSIPATFVGYNEAQVRYPATTPSEYESSPEIFRAFCPECGSAIHYRPQRDCEIHLYLGVFDNPSLYRATRHVFYDEHVNGYELSDNLPRFSAGSRTPSHWGDQPTRNVLFLCTDNARRSILAEAIAHRGSLNGIRAYSAGSHPAPVMDPATSDLLIAQNMNPDNYRSKSWEEFAGGLAFDWVITLSEGVHSTPFPPFRGEARREHWRLPEAGEDNSALEDVYRALETRIQTFMRR